VSTDRWCAIVTTMSLLMMFVYSACIYWSIMCILLLAGFGLDESTVRDEPKDSFARSTSTSNTDEPRVTDSESDTESNSDENPPDPDMGDVIDMPSNAKQFPVDGEILVDSGASCSAVARAGIYEHIDD
jgi:hypothetical protein